MLNQSCWKFLAKLPALLSLLAGLLAEMSPAPVCAQAGAMPPGPAGIQVTNLRQFLRLGTKARQGSPVRLEGVVVYADPVKNEVMFQDATGTLPVRVDLKSHPVQPAQRVIVDGATSNSFVRYPDAPSGSQSLAAFEAPVNISDHFVARVRGYLYPPQTGEYSFWVAADDAAELWLSTDETPGNARILASGFRFTAPREWDKSPKQHSMNVSLVAGQRYYIEALHLQTTGEDCLAVAWSGPDLQRAVIDGSFLSPWEGGSENRRPPVRGTLTRDFWLNYPNTGSSKISDGWRTNPPILMGQPFIVASQIHILSDQSLPEPAHVKLGEVVATNVDFPWAEAEGVVLQATEDGAYWTVLDLADGVHHLKLWVANPARETTLGVLNARVRVRGFCQAKFNGRGERVAGVFWVPSVKEITMVEPQADDWPRLTPIPVSQLLSSNSMVRDGQVIRVQGRMLEQNPGHTLTLRTGTSRLTAWVSPNGTDWNQVADAVEMPMKNSIYVGLAISSRTNDLICTGIVDHVSGLSAAWTNVDIGNPPLPGSAQFNTHTHIYTLAGSGGFGRAVDETADQFYFVGQPLENDGEIVARVAAVRGGDRTYANVGVMLRETLDPNAKSFSLALLAGSGTGGELRVRRATGNPIENTPCGNAPPYWLKLERQNSDQLRVSSRQSTPLAPDQPVEVMGVLERTNQSWMINHAFYRGVAAESNTPAATGRLSPAPSLAVQLVRRLSAEELAQGPRLLLRGVVTSKTDDLYVQDPTAGIRIPHLQAQKFFQCAAGDLIVVTGHCAAGDYSPVLLPDERRTITVLGPGVLPGAAPRTWIQLMSGAEDAQWVEVQGVVRAVAGRSLKFQMLGGVTTATLDFDFPEEYARRLVDATVRIQGVCKVIANERKQLVGITLLVPSFECVSVSEPSPEDPFAVNAYAINDLLKFKPQNELIHRVKLKGAATSQRGRSFFMQDATGGLRVEALADPSLHCGDQVEVVGFAGAGGFSPVLSEALVRKVGPVMVPQPVQVPMVDLLKGTYDARWVQLEGVFLGAKAGGADQVLEFQAQNRAFRTLLPTGEWDNASIPVGSRVKITGVFKADNLIVTEGVQSVASFEMNLDSSRGLQILNRPSWWTMQRMLSCGGIMIVALGATLFWIRTLRRQVEVKTQALQEEIQEHKRTEAQLADEIEERKLTETKLEYEIEESKRKELVIAQTHQELMIASRQAGQAEVASSVLHNVGNALNSVNIATNLIAEHLHRLRTTGLAKAVKLLREQTDLAVFFRQDPRGPQFLPYLEQWVDLFEKDKGSVLSKVKDLEENVGHIKEIVAMQQKYAKVTGVMEKLAVAEVIENAVKMHASALAERRIVLEREYENVPPILVDKHTFLQIMVNLLLNAKQACDEAEQPDKKIVLRIKALENQRVGIEVADNGIGIQPDNLTRIFAQGFSTRKNGHGFGLHSAACAAKEMHGTLEAYSEGLGRGSVFILELPAATNGA